MTTGWWRRNTAALIALGVLVPVSAVAIGWEGWQDYHLHRNTIPIDVEAGESVDLLETTWGPIRASEIADVTGLDAPSGAKVIAAAIPVDPHGDRPGCTAPTLVQQSTGIRWAQARGELGVGYSADEPTTCVTLEDAEQPYQLIVPFVVPSDAEGPFWIEVAPLDAEPSVIRFEVDP